MLVPRVLVVAGAEGEGGVDDVAIDGVHLQPPAAAVEGGLDPFGAMIGVPQLGGDEDVPAPGRPRPEGGPERLADRLFVAVALGCFAVGTATTEAVEDPEIRSSLADGLRGLDTDLEARFRLAREKGELKADADPATLAVLASGGLHTIAIPAPAFPASSCERSRARRWA